MFGPRIAGIAAVCLAAAVAACVAEQEDGGVAEQASQPISGRVVTPEERAACAASGREILPSGRLGEELCIHVHPDAGRPCTASTDCVGRCLNTGDFVDAGTPATGQCAPSDSPFGCWQLVENGVAGDAICVD